MRSFVCRAGIGASALAALVALPQSAAAQSMPGHAHGEAPPADHAHAGHAAPVEAGEQICITPGTIKRTIAGSGTSLRPGYEGGIKGPCNEHDGVMLSDGPWMVMTHGTTSLQYSTFSGPRGDDKLYATSMRMFMVDRETGWGHIQGRAMFSLEPTMGARGYPVLLASGETANGQPLVDRQHPHDFVMELAAKVDVRLSDSTRLFLYGGPVGEPALGPSAFMHRGSASLNPEPPITHHWFDSTHITFGVVTAGLQTPMLQIEGSAFRGMEPDEDRWDIETPELDSFAVRATLTPDPRWAFQASYGWLKEPERLHPGEDERRFTASAHYANLQGLSAMLAFSAKKHDGEKVLPAWLAEANWDLDEHNTLFARGETVINDELFPDHSHPLHDQRFRVSKLQLGYARTERIGPVELSFGAAGSVHAVPGALEPYYGDTPLGLTVFTRMKLWRNPFGKRGMVHADH